MDNEPVFGYEEKTVQDKIKDNLLEFIQSIAIVIAIAVVIRSFVAEPHRVQGNSMLDNFHPSDFIITDRISYEFSEPKRGDVVIIKNPRNNNENFIKRVIGLPQEEIKINNNRVYINNQLLSEPYLLPSVKTQGMSYLSDGQTITIPENQYFVMGDNRPASSDSREFGPVKKELFVGKAILRLWPLNKAAVIQNSVTTR